MDDFFVRLMTLTSDLSHRFVQLIEDLLVARDEDIDPQDCAVSFSGLHPRSLCTGYQSNLEECLAPSKLLDARRTAAFKETPSVNTSSEIVETQHSFWDSGPSIFQGLMFPIFGFRLAWKLTFACLKFSFIHARCTQIRVQSFMSRVQRTLRGSSDDIGWLQRTPGVPPVEDGTNKFMELLHCIRNGEHSLPSSFVYLLIPGLFSNHSSLYFVNTKRFFSKMGLTCHIAKIHSEASVEHNAWELKQYIEELYWGSSKRILLLGHSKGGVDAAAALSIYWPDLKEKVAGLALVQCPYGGSPIASDILRGGQIADREARMIMELLICKLIKGDMKALEDLTYDKRKEFITNYKLPEHVPLVSFYTETSIALGVLATMSHIAHAELPWFSLPTFDTEPPNSSCKVPVIIPLSAAMALSALHLKLRYGEMSDGLVTCRDAEVPGSVVVKPDRNLDHAWMVYSSWKKDMEEADADEMCEALFTLLVEIGKVKQEHESHRIKEFHRAYKSTV